MLAQALPLAPFTRADQVSFAARLDDNGERFRALVAGLPPAECAAVLQAARDTIPMVPRSREEVLAWARIGNAINECMRSK